MNTEEKKKFNTDLKVLITSSESTLSVIEEFRKTKEGDVYIDDVLNFFHFLVTYVQDLGVSMILYIKCDNSLEENLQARSMAVICNQFIEEYRILKGGNILRGFKKVNAPIKDVEQALKEFDWALKAYSKKYGNYFENIRNNSIAHRSTQMTEYYKFKNSLESDEVFLRAGKLVIFFRHIDSIFKKFAAVLDEFVKKQKQ